MYKFRILCAVIVRTEEVMMTVRNARLKIDGIQELESRNQFADLRKIRMISCRSQICPNIVALIVHLLHMM